MLDCVYVQQILEKTQTSYTYLADAKAEHMCIGNTEGAEERDKPWAYLKMALTLNAACIPKNVIF